MDCEKCALHKLCNTGSGDQFQINYIKGFGSKKAKIMFIAESPRKLEAKEKSNQAMLESTFINCLDSIGLKKEDIYFTYMVRCRTENKRQKNGSYDFSPPKVKEIAECREYLLEEIEEVQPNVIVLLGETVTKTLLKLKGVKNIHGTPYWSEEFNSTLVPTFSINEISSSPLDKELKFMEDLLFAKESSTSKGFVDKPRRETNYFVTDTMDKFRAFMSKLIETDSFVFDIETTGLNPDSSDLLCIAFSCKETTGMVVPMKRWTSYFTEARIEIGVHELIYEDVEVLVEEGKKKTVIEQKFVGTTVYELEDVWNRNEKKEILETYKKLFESETIEKIAHNEAFDIGYLNRLWNMDIKGPYYCTMLAEYLVNPESTERRSLEDMAWRETDMGGYDGGLKDERKVGFRNTKESDLYHYAACDADCTLRIKNNQVERVEPFLELLRTIVVPLSIVVTEMQYNGITIDIPMIEKLMVKYGDAIIKHEKILYTLEDVKEYIKLYEAKESKPIIDKWNASARIQKNTPKVEDYVAKYLKPFNFGSTLMLRGLLYDHLDLPVTKTTASKLPSTDEATLETLRGRHAVLDSLLELRHLKKIYSTYLKAMPGMVDGDSKVHTSFRVDRTATGRLASSKPNLQNIPKKKEGKEIRDYFTASPGHYLIESDLRQIEFRVLANFVGDEKMIKDIADGLDIHRQLASEIYHVAPEDVTDQQRSNSKSVTFGIPYGRSAMSLAGEFGMDIGEAEAFIQAFFSRYPKVKTWIEDQIALAEERGFVNTFFGRIRYLPKIHDPKEGTRAAEVRKVVATIIQGTANDILSIYTINTRNRLLKEGLNSKLVISVHDAIFIDVVKAELKQVLKIVKEEMERPIDGIIVPIETEVQIGERWGSMKVFDNWHKIF